METITFTYKTKIEQFQEQFPELYREIWNLGYNMAIAEVFGVEEPTEEPSAHSDENDEYNHYDTALINYLDVNDYPTESDPGVIDEMYPDLVYAVEYTKELPKQ
jgi:hypothetical protein